MLTVRQRPPIAGESLMTTTTDNPASIVSCLRIGAGFHREEHAEIIERLSSLDARLMTYAATSTDLALSVKDRERPGQAITLECWVPRRTRLVATSSNSDLASALGEVRDKMRRQLDDAKSRREPQNIRSGHAKLSPSAWEDPPPGD